MPTHPTSQTHDAAIPVFARWFGSWRISVDRQPLDPCQLARFYDAAAATWDDKLARLGIVDGYEHMLRQVLPRDSNRRQVLDAGIGTGALSVALANVAHAPFDLSGVDVSAGMLAQAQHHLAQHGICGELKQGDITALPYADNHFDMVMTAHTLEHLLHPGNAIDEMVRVLRPGGMMVACVTRQSMLGAYIQVKWRTHRVSPEVGRRWFVDSGLRGTRMIPMRGGCNILDRLSVAYVGWKEDERR